MMPGTLSTRYYLDARCYLVVCTFSLFLGFIER